MILHGEWRHLHIRMKVVHMQTEKDYQFLPSKNDHFVSGKITRTFSTSKPGVYTFTFNALTYGGYEMKPVTVTITAVDADTAKGEEAMK